MARFHLFWFFFGWVVFHCIYIPHLLYPFIHWWALRLFWYLGCCKWCHDEHGAHVSFQISVFVLFKYRPGLEFLSHVVVLFLVFLSSLHSVLYSSCTNLQSYQQSRRVFHILTSVYYLCSFWWQPFWQVWGYISLWFWFEFPWWLAMLSIFTCPCWPSTFPLWKNVYSLLLHTF